MRARHAGLVGASLLLLAACAGDESSAPAAASPSGGPPPCPDEGAAGGAPGEPLVETGLVLPPNSLPCVPVSTGVPQYDCNHHGSTVAELPDGTIAIVWYHGEAEKSVDSRILWSRRAPGEAGFSPPEVLFDDPARSEGNPALWVAEDGRLFVFFVSIYGAAWHESIPRLVVSSDGGASFSEPVELRGGSAPGSDDYCLMTRNRPLRLAGGELLLPLYDECFAMPAFMRSSDDFATWEEDAPLAEPLHYVSQIQPALIRMGDGGVASIHRDGSSNDRIKRMTGDAEGRNWSYGEPIALPNSGTAVDQVRLSNGHVVVVLNNSPEGRFPLSVALSLDEGATYVALRDIDIDCPSGSCSFAYPSIVQSAADGSIWISYTHDRQTIGWVRFNEAWLAEGSDPVRLVCLPAEACRDGSCFSGCGDDSGCDAEAGERCVEGACRVACPASCCPSGQACADDGLCAALLPTTCGEG